MVVAPLAAARASAASRASVAEGVPVERRRSLREARAGAEGEPRREPSVAKSKPATTDDGPSFFFFLLDSLSSSLSLSFPSPSFLSSTARYSVDFRANSAPKPASGTRPPAPRERQPFWKRCCCCREEEELEDEEEEEEEEEEERGEGENAHEGDGSAGLQAYTSLLFELPSRAARASSECIEGKHGEPGAA